MCKKLLFLTLWAPVSLWAQLTLDPSYAVAGINNTGLAGSNTYSSGIAGISNASYFAADNSVYVPYSLNPFYSVQFPNLAPTIGVKKYLEDGSLDPNFGTNGTALYTANYHATRFVVDGITQQPDGKLLLVGRSYSYGGWSPDYYSFICRLNADGTKDTTFGSNGQIIINLYVENSADTNDERFADVAVDDQGRIIAVGYAYWYLGSNIYDSSAIAMRFTPDGIVDTTFANNGKLEFSLPGQDTFSNLYPVGGNHFLLLGTTAPANGQADLLVSKIDADGNLDTTFGTGGKTQISFGGVTLPLKIMFPTDHKLLISGMKVGSGIAFGKLNADGSLDTSFSADGINVTSISVPGHYALASEAYPGMSSDHISLLPDGKIILISTARISNQYDYAIARLKEDTTLDTSFMTSGVFWESILAFDWARGIHVQSDGKVVTIVNSSIYKYLNFSVLGLEESPEIHSLETYPNPTVGMLYLGKVVENAILADLTGKTLARFTTTDQIDLSDFAAGVYLLTIIGENGNQEIKKIVKQ